MSGIASIRASVLIPLVQQIDRSTGKGDILLATHGILRSQLNDPYAAVPMSRYVALFEDSARITGDECLGARMGLLFKAGDIGPTGVLFSISPTIKAAFQRISRFVHSLQGATTSGLYEYDNNLVWSYRLADETLWPRRQDSEFSLSASCQMVRTCFSRSWRPLEVHFEHRPPRSIAVLERIFRAPLKFGQSSNRIIFERSDGERLYRAEDAALTSVLERHIADLLDRDQEPASVQDKVQSLIEIYLGHKRITLATIADELGISQRTLQRRLSEEGTSLRAMIEGHRRILTAKQLDASVKKSRIAETLGYADSTVFWRAHKKWTQPQN